MNTIERLERYHPFDEQLIGRIAEVAEEQQGLSYEEFFKRYNIPEPEMRTNERGRAFTVLDIEPQGDFDETHARVVHIPMANPLDLNQIYQAATIFAVDPTVRLVATSNPSGPGYPGNTLTHAERKRVWTGDVSPTVDPVLEYLHEHGISQTDQIGYSWGVNKANAATTRSQAYDQEVGHMVHIEPADVKQRSLLQLGSDFAKTAKMLKAYVELSDVPAFLSARKESISAMGYNVGLMRLSNLAIAKALVRGEYEQKTVEAMEAQPEVKTHVAWGSNSELADDSLMLIATQRLQEKFGAERVATTRLTGEKHALANDIHLQAALIHHRLKR